MTELETSLGLCKPAMLLQEVKSLSNYKPRVKKVLRAIKKCPSRTKPKKRKVQILSSYSRFISDMSWGSEILSKLLTNLLSLL